jgi:hypothetical protein
LATLKFMNWSQKHIEHLQRDGKIRGFHVHEKQKGFSSDKNIHQGTRQRSKALDWLGWNLPFWANENSVTIEKEYKFCDRGWRFDWAFPFLKIAVEFEGGIFMNKSGHTNVNGYNRDTEKYNKAQILGWRVIRVTAMNYTTVLKQLNELVK